ncbi:MAG: BlaI/MecI/CopY family transcriptional regulator [Bacteroidales bacterium]|nr:BlaI/MecI/CopY family transcriptional regulator [Bacteroidales bacterium]
MKQLTRAEEQVMQVLWDLKKAYVKDIIEEFPEPKPAYNTISTIIRILEKKGVIGYTPIGKAHEYFPMITKKAYRKSYFKNILSNYFGNNYMTLTSFFTKEQNLSLEELEGIKKLIDEQIEQKKQ